jgi:hypothetical protein
MPTIRPSRAVMVGPEAAAAVGRYLLEIWRRVAMTIGLLKWRPAAVGLPIANL